MKMTQRERYFVTAAGLVLAIFVGYFFIYRPLAARSAAAMMSTPN